MGTNYNNNGFQKPDAEEYKRRRKNNSKKSGDNSEQLVNNSSNNSVNKNKTNKDKGNQINYKNITDINSNKELQKRKGDLVLDVDEKIDPAEERKQNIIFAVTVAIFLVIVIIAKVAYTNMQNGEKLKLAQTKWYVYEEADVKKVGNLELEFKNNGTFDLYKADSQVSCMSGDYSIIYKGKMKLKSDERGFNPPGEWKCKKNSSFKYKNNGNTLKMSYKGVEVTFYKLGGQSEEKAKDPITQQLHKKHFVNKQAKMLTTFYNSNMYIYKLDKTNDFIGKSGEVLGEICFSGEYVVDPDKNKITVNVDEEYYEITSNELWEGMTEYKEYEFKYKLSDKNSKLTLQYEDKAYEFEKHILDE
ncbi:MAG: hypothetical protein E7262_00005 [Lachnospiraceae bacterium]|nr:hypothetical protein [Lachnospiraceae bacterium]